MDNSIWFFTFFFHFHLIFLRIYEYYCWKINREIDSTIKAITTIIDLNEKIRITSIFYSREENGTKRVDDVLIEHSLILDRKLVLWRTFAVVKPPRIFLKKFSNYARLSTKRALRVGTNLRSLQSLSVIFSTFTHISATNAWASCWGPENRSWSTSKANAFSRWTFRFVLSDNLFSNMRRVYEWSEWFIRLHGNYSVGDKMKNSQLETYVPSIIRKILYKVY